MPITKWYDAGKPNEELVKIIRANVREPDQVLGDIHAQVAGNNVGGARLKEFMAEFGLTSIEPLADEIITRSERAMRDAIATVPDGVYTPHRPERRLRRAGDARGDDHQEGRHDSRRLGGLQPRQPARHQCRPQLHARLRDVRPQVRALPGCAEQRGLVPPRHGHRAARIAPQCAAARAGRRAACDRPFPARHRLRRARARAAGAGDRGGRREYLGHATDRRAPATAARAPMSGSPAAAPARARPATASTRPPSRPASWACPSR